MNAIAIDARMALSSGIGTIITNVAPRLIAGNPARNVRLLGDPAVLGKFPWAGAANATIVPFTAPIYSIAEQTAFPLRALDGCGLLWSPNYNIPLGWARKLLVNVNDLAHLVLPEMRASPLKQFYAKFMFAQVRRRAGVIAYISQFTANEFHRLLGAPRGRERIIPCGVDESWFAVTSGPHKRPHPYILFVGNVKPHKNLSRLLDAFALVREQMPHDLLIVGRKEGFITGDNDVFKRIEAFDGRVSFTGYVSDDALKQIFAGAAALVLPSLYEGFGLPPVEAMAAGCPVLVSRTASLPEVCQDAALYCDPLDVADIAAGLRRIVGDDALRRTLEKKGLARARELNWTVCAAGYEQAIASLL